MTADWEIVSISEDLGSTEGEDRWLVVYRVPVEYAPDGFHSYSFPKNMLNIYAAVYEYDIDDPAQLDELFDHVMSIPMLKAPRLTVNRSAGLVAEKAVDAVIKQGRLATTPKHALSKSAGEARSDVKAAIDELKRGAAPLTYAKEVRLTVEGLPAVADTSSENPKYILKRDMLARIDPDAVAKGREYHQKERSVAMSRAPRDGRGARDGG